MSNLNTANSKHVATFMRRATAAHESWSNSTKITNKRIPNVSAKRAQGMRKSIIDNNMRYTELVNLASDWAWGLHQAGETVPVISKRVPANRQAQALLDLVANHDASWISKLMLSQDNLPTLRNAGDDYNANWLIAHDTRWGVDILSTVYNRMAAAGLIASN